VFDGAKSNRQPLILNAAWLGRKLEKVLSCWRPQKPISAPVAADFIEVVLSFPAPARRRQATAESLSRSFGWNQTMEYNENEVLTRYIWDHCRHLMSETERRVNRAGVARAKAAAAEQDGSAPLAEMLRRRWGSVGDPEIEAALTDGIEAFRECVAVRLRALAEVQALISRCPGCSRIVRTPRARQCLWCRYDWHDHVHRSSNLE
jgi:hypothetical protein